jgi:hypothetical protein
MRTSTKRLMTNSGRNPVFPPKEDEYRARMEELILHGC